MQAWAASIVLQGFLYVAHGKIIHLCFIKHEKNVNLKTSYHYPWCWPELCWEEQQPALLSTGWMTPQIPARCAESRQSGRLPLRLTHSWPSLPACQPDGIIKCLAFPLHCVILVWDPLSHSTTSILFHGIVNLSALWFCEIFWPSVAKLGFSRLNGYSNMTSNKSSRGLMGKESGGSCVAVILSLGIMRFWKERITLLVNVPLTTVACLVLISQNLFNSRVPL